MSNSKPYIIHVNKQFIAFNRKHPDNQLPVYTVKHGKDAVRYGYCIVTTGPCILVDPRKHKQLNCGARAWIETFDPIYIKDEMTYQEVLNMKKEIENNGNT